ncbi:MAG TPA: cation acetate symporter [Candidatus Nitrosotalea sp.]|nr:cation acetate symporter [Candidatus Nitrosotalea sp.]
MSSSPATAVGLVLMLALTVGLGVYARRFGRSTSDLLVAARTVRPRLNAAAISGEYLSAASFLGIAGLVMQFGYDVLWYPVGYAAGYLVLLIFIAGPLRRFGAYTIPDFAEGRFDSPAFRRVAVCLVILIGLFYMLPQMKAAGITVSAATGAPYPIGVVAIAAVVVALVAGGGMGGITVVQAFQFAVKIFAISLPVFVLCVEFGSPSHLFAQLGSRVDPQLPAAVQFTVHPGDEWTLARPTSVLPQTPLRVRLLPPRSSAGGTYPALGGPTGSGAGQGRTLILRPPQQTLPAGSVVFSDAGRVGLRAGAPVPFGASTPASSNRAWALPFGPLAGGGGHPLLFTYSLLVGILCGTMGLPHILVRFYTNPDARSARRTAWLVLVLLGLFYLWPPLYGVLGRLQDPALYTQKLTDSVVLLLPRLLFPGWLGALMAAVVSAGAFAAFTSTLSGLLVSLAGALGHDLYGRWWRPESSPRARRRAFRLAAIVAGAGAAGLGLTVQSFDISVLVGWAFAIAASSFFPLLVLGIWWRGLTALGAALGATLGGLAATAGIVTTMLQPASPALTSFLDRNSGLAVIFSQPAIVTIPLSFALMVSVSLALPHPPGQVSLKMLQLHVPERLGLRHDYIPE